MRRALIAGALGAVVGVIVFGRFLSKVVCPGCDNEGDVPWCDFCGRSQEDARATR